MNELKFRLALTRVPQLGPVQARILVDHFGSATAIFNASSSRLKNLEGIGDIRANSISKFRDFASAENEAEFLLKNNIQPLFLTDPDYPKRLLHCQDPPTLLFYKGNASLNVSKIIAVVGTRKNSPYGKQITEKLITDLASEQILVVSGLAYGIDAIAHHAALNNNLNTIGVLGHGLDLLYPPQHEKLARGICAQGGLLTEFPRGTNPDKHNFPSRNRIVAGMCDATIVVETDIRGGSMITAELANGYNKDVFAFPGRTIDQKSAGCNHLIQTNKAMLLTGASELLQNLGWTSQKTLSKKVQRQLFIELTPEEKTIFEIIKEKETVHIDEINLSSGLSSSKVAAAILNLELKNVLLSLPGKLYQIA